MLCFNFSCWAFILSVMEVSQAFCADFEYLFQRAVPPATMAVIPSIAQPTGPSAAQREYNATFTFARTPVMATPCIDAKAICTLYIPIALLTKLSIGICEDSSPFNARDIIWNAAVATVAIFVIAAYVKKAVAKIEIMLQLLRKIPYTQLNALKTDFAAHIAKFAIVANSGPKYFNKAACRPNCFKVL